MSDVWTDPAFKHIFGWVVWYTGPFPLDPKSRHHDVVSHQLFLDTHRHVITTHIALIIYNLLLHPLCKFPGLKLDSTSQLLWSYHLIKGDSSKYISALHQAYGPIVRTASNELSFTSSTAWKEIYGAKSGLENTYEKNDVVYLQGNQDNSNIFFAPSQQHAKLRKLLAPAFSDRAVREQEYLVHQCVEQFISGLHNRSRSGKAHFPNQNGTVNIAAWFTFETFDVLSSLAFGAPLGSLRMGDYHPWVNVIFGAVKHSTFTQAAWRLKPYHRVLEWFIPGAMGKQYEAHLENCAKTIAERVEAGSAKADLDVDADTAKKRGDMLSHIVGKLPVAEVVDSVNIIVAAGGDATATTMTSVIYYITRSPRVYGELVREIRGAFDKQYDITFAAVAKLKYLKAVIDETMRIHPSVPVGLPRVVPRGGRFIDGRFVPEGTWVSVTQLAAYRFPEYWVEPENFHPERWLGDSRFDGDNRDVFHPFSIGSRNCIGLNLALSNSRLAIARLLWNFDLEAQADNVDPHGFLEFGLWEHHPLNVRLTAVVR